MFNLGTGDVNRIGDLSGMTIKKIGTSIRVKLDEERLRPQRSEVKRLLSDNSLARGGLAWDATMSLDDGLDKTISWIRDNLNHCHIVFMNSKMRKT